MQRNPVIVGLAGSLVIGLVGLSEPAHAQTVELVNDVRNVRTMSATEQVVTTHDETARAGFGQDFSSWTHYQGNHGSTISRQGSVASVGGGGFGIGGHYVVYSSLDSDPSPPETYYADAFMDMQISTSAPIEYEVWLTWQTEGQASGYFRGLSVSETDEPNVYYGSGNLSPGTHGFRSWANASTATEPVFQPGDVTSDILVDGGWAAADIWFTGHVTPTPAAVGPGLALMGLLMMRRRRDHTPVSPQEHAPA